ncbi:hypothetical protein D5086_013444 [Populus alba]|uniref:Uncharacterized protein n=1 Tax=Populus alba TaxID=43335 RepID=A0ACC4C6V4_POPAL
MKSMKGRFLKKLNFIPSISTLKQGLVSHLNSTESFSYQNLQIPPIYIQEDPKKDILAGSFGVSKHKTESKDEELDLELNFVDKVNIATSVVSNDRVPAVDSPEAPGRYIGGADEVIGLHEQGRLKKLLAVVRSLKMIRMMRSALDALNVMKTDWLSAPSAAESPAIVLKLFVDSDSQVRIPFSSLKELYHDLIMKQAGKGDDNTGKNQFKVGLCGVWSLVGLSLNHCQVKRQMYCCQADGQGTKLVLVETIEPIISLEEGPFSLIQIPNLLVELRPCLACNSLKLAQT